MVEKGEPPLIILSKRRIDCPKMFQKTRKLVKYFLLKQDNNFVELKHSLGRYVDFGYPSCVELHTLVCILSVIIGHSRIWNILSKIESEKFFFSAVRAFSQIWSHASVTEQLVDNRVFFLSMLSHRESDWLKLFLYTYRRYRIRGCLLTDRHLHAKSLFFYLLSWYFRTDRYIISSCEYSWFFFSIEMHFVTQIEQKLFNNLKINPQMKWEASKFYSTF